MIFLNILFPRASNKIFPVHFLHSPASLIPRPQTQLGQQIAVSQLPTFCDEERQIPELVVVFDLDFQIFEMLVLLNSCDVFLATRENFAPDLFLDRVLQRRPENETQQVKKFLAFVVFKKVVEVAENADNLFPAVYVLQLVLVFVDLNSPGGGGRVVANNQNQEPLRRVKQIWSKSTTPTVFHFSPVVFQNFVNDLPNFFEKVKSQKNQN